MVVDDELIAKYLAGEANPDEAEALVDWMAVPQNATYFKKIQATWDSTFPSKAFKTTDKGRAWSNVSTEMTKASPRNPRVISSFRISIRHYGVAASLIVGLFAVGFYLMSRPKLYPATEIASAASTFTIMLPDSSGVVLNRNSVISYPDNFGEQRREVDFKGEAFFRVKGDTKKPFVIHTGIADIRVVGTVFNVRQNMDSVQVSVEEGKVLVYTADDSTYLEAGHAATIRAGTRAIDVINKVDKNAWGYATRKFVFQDAPLSQVFENIENAYACSIEIGNKNIKNCKLTASFDHVSAREMLNLIGETLDLTIQQNESAFRVEGKGCPWIQ